MSRPVLQPWVCGLPFMQQSVLMSAIRGCDGIPKFHKAKPLIKWYRRCVLLSAFDNAALTDPLAPGGGSFTGPIGPPWFWTAGCSNEHDYRCGLLQKVADDFLDSRDELPAHYTVHCMHAFEICGYHHPDEQISDFWNEVYGRLAKAYHLWPETQDQMDRRLSDDETHWRERNDVSASCSD